MTAEFKLVRRALKGARSLARKHRRGGLQSLWRLTQDALVALDHLEEQSRARQLALPGLGETTAS